MSKIPLNAVKVEGVIAPMPYLRKGKPHESFVAIRSEILKLTGVDFLGVCGDLMRPADAVSDKHGVVFRSFHKTGRAFDYDQGQIGKNAVLVLEEVGGNVYFRTFIKCKSGYERFGNDISKTHKQWVGGIGPNAAIAPGFYVDFTAVALKFGFHRIAAWRDWARSNRKKYSTSMEFWHYQMDEGMTWAEAMADLNSGGTAATPTVRLIGLNDRGPWVRELETNLALLGWLDGSEVNDVFDADSDKAVRRFQVAHKLKADGLAGRDTQGAIAADLRKAA